MAMALPMPRLAPVTSALMRAILPPPLPSHQLAVPARSRCRDCLQRGNHRLALAGAAAASGKRRVHNAGIAWNGAEMKGTSMNVLEGIRVIDLTMWAFVPSAGGVLAHWGADVI